MKLSFKQFNTLLDKVSTILANKHLLSEYLDILKKRIMKVIFSSDESKFNNLVLNNDLTSTFKDEIEHICDFLSNIGEQEALKSLKGNYEQILINANKWTKTSQKQGEKLKGIQEAGLIDVFTFNDGFKIVKLNSKDHCKREGNIMGHCVGGYNPNTKTILSLRDPKNQPHATMEVNKKNQILQIKGKQNSAPIPKYQEYIRVFLDAFPKLIVIGDAENIGYVKWRGDVYNPNSIKWKQIYKTQIIPFQNKAINAIKRRIKNNTINEIIIIGLYLKQLPDFSNIIVTGDFYCSNNQLTSLQGAPQKVGGAFYCSNNQLTSLQGAPQEVGGFFYCSNNQLTSLQGAPQKVDGGFYCSNNQLTSLQGAPQKVGGAFYCSNNQLTSLQGAPQEVGGDFDCNNNQLTPRQIKDYLIRVLAKHGNYEK